MSQIWDHGRLEMMLTSVELGVKGGSGDSQAS